MKQYNYLILSVFFLLFSLNMIQSINQEDEIVRKKYFNTKYLKTPNKEIQIEFCNDVFYLKWSAFDQNTSTLEFLRDNETTNNYKQMITVVTPVSSVSFADFTNSYLKMIQQFQVKEPIILKNKESKYEGEIIIDVLLLDKDNDRVEHVLAKIFVDDKKHVNCIVLSTVLKYSDIKNNSDLLKNEIGDKRINWLNNYGNIYFITFP